MSNVASDHWHFVQNSPVLKFNFSCLFAIHPLTLWWNSQVLLFFLIFSLNDNQLCYLFDQFSVVCVWIFSHTTNHWKIHILQCGCKKCNFPIAFIDKLSEYIFCTWNGRNPQRKMILKNFLVGIFSWLKCICYCW